MVGWLVLSCLMSLSTIFQLYRGRSVLLVEETGGPRKKPPTCRKSLTNLITYCCTPCPERV